ncbi:pseudouridylate synthase 7 homolog isoform X2 [Patella vulgata]|uniref:pseudouridylate synthase 7 homolog isoform X2 n=1 Tax=Patella vulgata TaxID=6465 RepID=UPI00218016D1|nr:pseudouridylate synthase 7 homolog isoform X2 [Patella vulgata]
MDVEDKQTSIQSSEMSNSDQEPPSKKMKIDTNDIKGAQIETNTIRDEKNCMCEKDVGIIEYISKHNGFNAIIKQRYSDFIVNEINMEGDIVRLTSFDIPLIEKTNTNCEVINKIDREKLKEMVENKDHDTQVIIEVEDSKEERTRIHLAIRDHFPALESSTIDVDNGQQKHIKVVYPKSKANRDSRWAANRPKYCKFVLYKENKDTMDTISLISKNMRVNTNLFQYAGTKDKRAKTTQEVTAFKVDAERLKNLNDIMRNMGFGNFRYVSSPLKLGQSSGNHFTLVLRNVEGSDDQIELAVSSLQSHGFINYFGMQRFGTTTVSTHSVGKAILRENYKLAVDLILRPRDGDDKSMIGCRKIWSETKDAKKMLDKLPAYHNIEKSVLYVLSKQGSNMYYNALQAIPRNLRLLYVHSYQSYIWNSMVSRRIQLYGFKLVEGDLVLNTDDNSKGESKMDIKPVVIDEDNMKDYSILDVVLPLPGYEMIYPTNNVGELYKELLAEDGIDITNMKTKHKDFSVPGTYRKMVVKPTHVNKRIIYYNDHTMSLALSDLDILNGVEEPKSIEGGKWKALKLEFSLPTSAYATMALREILKIDTSWAHQSTLNVT